MAEEKEISPEEPQKKLQECDKQRGEYLAGWQRARADFLNYKKEEMERISALLEYGKEAFIIKILPILDNFDFVEKAIPEELKNNEHVRGVLQGGVQLRNFLKNQGVQEIKTTGERFDPNFHEVAEGVEKEEMESGIIVEEVQKGYTMNGRLFRPAKVRVAK